MVAPTGVDLHASNDVFSKTWIITIAGDTTIAANDLIKSVAGKIKDQTGNVMVSDFTVIAADTTAPKVATITASGTGGSVSGEMDDGDTIVIVFNDSMDVDTMGTEFFIEAKHTGSKVVKIHKGSDNSGPVIADFTTQNFAATGASLTFTAADIGVWSTTTNANDTLTLTLDGESGTNAATGTLSAARGQAGSIDKAGNAAAADTAATTAIPVGNFGA